MRYILLAFLSLSLVLMSIFVVLSFKSGVGYVYVQWLGWQVQTNLFVLCVLIFLLAVILYLFGTVAKRIIRRQVQKHHVPHAFNELHAYEQLGVFWLLNADQIENQRIHDLYQNSVWIQPLILAKIAMRKNKNTTAHQYLRNSENPLFELYELLKIDLALNEKNYAIALERLEFLTVQPLSAWLETIQEAYQDALHEKWLLLVQQCPWWLFYASEVPKFNEEQKNLWLQSLLAQAESRSDYEGEVFINWFLENTTFFQTLRLDNQILLLKIMSQFDALSTYTFEGAKEILGTQFSAEVLYIWLDQGLKQDQLQIAQMAEQIDQWQQYYPAQPSLTFADWHILQHLGRKEEASELLSQFPEDPYMAYLRLQHALQNQQILQQDLSLLLNYSKQDFKFDL